MSNYPRDEFDAVPENASRHGVHRTALEAPRRSLIPLLAFGILALLIGVAAFLVLPGLVSGTPRQVSGSFDSTTAAVTSSSGAPSASSSAPTTASAAAPTSAPASTSAPATTTAPAVDKTTAVSVFNATGIPGLAGKYGNLVTSNGWPLAQTGNWAGAAQPSSAVFYSVPKQKASADALAALLHISRVVQTDQLGVPLAVVLGPGTQ